MTNFELKLLDNLLPKLSKLNLLTGNEDAVAWKTPDIYRDELQICNIDSIALSADALPRDMSLYDFGAKLVVVTLSDLVAKGAQPVFFLCSINGPGNSSESFNEIISGIQQRCLDFNIAYLGGDLGLSSEFVLTGVCIGYVPLNHLIKRANAQVGDLLCVTGDFGYTGIGYAIYLDSNFKLPPNHPLLKKIKQKLNRPDVKLEFIPYLRKYATAAIDSSDGLSLSLYHLSKASNVKVGVDQLPLAEEIIKHELNLNLLNIVAYAGEEFEIIFTIKVSDYPNFINELKSKKISVPRIIGKIEKGTGVSYKDQELIPQGWDSLRNPI